jgi:hypothetical protein
MDHNIIKYNPPSINVALINVNSLYLSTKSNSPLIATRMLTMLNVNNNLLASLLMYYEIHPILTDDIHYIDSQPFKVAKATKIVMNLYLLGIQKKSLYNCYNVNSL